HLVPHWTWKKRDIGAAWCYYNEADYGGPMLKGKRLGKSTTSDESLHAEGKVAFELGVLKVAQYGDGKVVQGERRHTAGEVANVHLEVEHDKYAAGDATDLYFITVSLRDDKGNIVTDNDLEIEFSADNNCAVLGTDNGYQADLQGLTRPIRKTFKGYAVGYIMKNDIKNAAALTIKSKLGSKTIQL